jgi:hypothetical protein
VITIEPGVYVPFDNAFPKAFHGLGIRIEVGHRHRSAKYQSTFGMDN